MHPASQERNSHLIVLVGGTLIDGVGGTPIKDTVVVIEGNRISSLGKRDATAVPKGPR